MKMENKINRTFSAQISTVLLKTIIKLAGGIQTDIAKLCFTPNDMTIVAVDPAIVAMMHLKLTKTAFDKFEATEFEIGIVLEHLKNVVNLARIDDIITIKFDCKNDQLVINIDNLQTRMGIINPNEIPEAPTFFLGPSGHVVAPVNILKRGFTAAEYVNDTVLLSLDPEKFELKCEKNMDSVHLILQKKDLIEHKSDAHHKNSFSTNYLSDVLGCLNDEYNIRLRLGTEAHLQLDYDFSGGDGHMTFVLMPQIDS